MTISSQKHFRIEKQWSNLLNQFLHFSHDDSIWVHSSSDISLLPDQGWKLHISATIHNANSLFKLVAPILLDGHWHFKAPRSIAELKKLNSGLFYGYSQIGKFITVYSRSTDDFLELVNKLKPITAKFKAPSVPSDKLVPSSSCLFYRYGSFKSKSSSENIESIINPNGNLIPDRRERQYAVPDWLSDPFENFSFSEKKYSTSVKKHYKFFERYKPYKAISQRGKGGVYLAIDFKSTPFKTCVIKEGRRNGEVDWSWQDGFTRVQQEGYILKDIEHLEINTPRLIDSIKYPNHIYIVIEHINGNSLDKVLYKINKKFPIDDVLHIAYILAFYIDRLHGYSITWRDIKPMNIIINEKSDIYIIDFEGAIKGNEIIDDPWGSSGYVPPEWLAIRDHNGRIKQDLFAFGATLHHLLTGKPPKSPLPKIGCLRKGIPMHIRTLIDTLVSNDPKCRPSINEVIAILSEWKNVTFSDSTLSSIKNS